MQKHPRGRTPITHGAFTLIELVVAMTLMTLVMGSVVSVVVLSSKSLDVVSAQTVTGNISDAIMRISSDLRQAKSFTSTTATSVTFTVPDRTGDAVEDKLTYAWTGTTGDPITLQLNSETAVIVIEDVQAFSMDYILAKQVAWAGASAPDTGITINVLGGTVSASKKSK